jgi:hypothetical protein
VPKQDSQAIKDSLELRRRSISEAFHTFHQPLTTLHCGLEIALAKPRTEAEYRKRMQEMLVHAGAVLQLNKALRELVEALDPGERFGTVPLEQLLAQVANEVAVVTETAGVSITCSDLATALISADPMKLLRAFAAVLLEVAAQLEPGGTVSIRAMRHCATVHVSLSWQEKKRQAPETVTTDQRVQAIRSDAARCYIQTIGGQIVERDVEVDIALPLAT